MIPPVMSRHLPTHPNLEHLKKQVRDLLVDMQRENPRCKLADAFHALANHERGDVVTARWRGARVLEAVVTKNGQTEGQVTYAVSPDRKTLTLSAGAHNTVFDRSA